MDINLKTLIAKLNDVTRTAATRAAGICVGFGQYEVDIEHLFLALLEQPGSDLVVAAREAGVSTTGLESDLRKEVERLPSGSARTPVFSRHLPVLFEHAWLIASLNTAAQPQRIRSGHLLLALLTEPGLAQLAQRASRHFAGFPLDRLKHDFDKLTHGSDEAPAVAPEAQAPSADPVTELQGSAPGKTPALDQYTTCLTARAREGKLDPVIGRDAEIRQLAKMIWKEPVTDKGIVVGRGRLFYPGSIRTVLESIRCVPDFEVTNSSAWIDFIHRTTEAAEIYFITNRKKEQVRTECLFRVSGRQPELWDPVSGKRWIPRYRQEQGRTQMMLNLDVFQSLFIVFPKVKTKGLSGAASDTWQQERAFRKVQELTGSWELQFDPRWGGPATIRFAALQDWSLHPDPGIRYYSGKAVYRKQFSFSDAVSSGPLFLELGVVKNICRVWLNGADLGIVWTAPWRLEVTGKLKHGVNDIRIEVINLWPNRLIGDAALPPEQRRTNTNITFKKEDPLLPSGLLGPVCLMTVGP